MMGGGILQEEQSLWFKWKLIQDDPCLMFLTQRLKMVLFIYNLHGGDADRRGACDVGFGFGDVGVGYVGVGDVAVAVEDGDGGGDEREIGWNLEGTIFRSGDSSADDLT